jgi:DNA-binding CsgD family transcriptional regulator/predicted transcriptional regulator
MPPKRPTLPAATGPPSQRPLLGARDSETYRVILVSPGLPAAEIGGRTGRAPAAVRASLSRLTRLGLVSKAGRRPVTYTANRPSASLSEHERLLQAALEDHRHLVTVFEELYAVGQSEHAHQLIEVVMGKENITRRFFHLEATVRREILVFDRPPYVLPPGTASQRAAEQALLARGVTVRSIYDRRSLEAEGGLELITALTQAGEQARLAPDLPVKVAIFDRAAALLPLSEESGDDRVVIIRRSTMLTVLIAFFERVWNEAVPFLTPTDAAPEVPDPRARPHPATGVLTSGEKDTTDQMLSLLAAGFGDAAIARQLGVSERTIGRRVRALMDELGAGSRFQAGVEIARRGLLAAGDAERFD